MLCTEVMILRAQSAFDFRLRFPFNILVDSVAEFVLRAKSRRLSFDSKQP